jgi:Ca2+-binding RTX toxin-like protein
LSQRLTGVTQTPDGTLYIAGNPYAADTITITDGNVTFNGTPIAFSSAAINDIVVATGRGHDSVTATGTNENILAFLGTGNDTYRGGNLTDAVQGGAGHDDVRGGPGNDRLFGMIGNDTVMGEDGADIVSVDTGGTAGQTQTLNGGTGNDLLLVTGTSFNDRITVWDPDGNLGAIGSTLTVTVSNPVNSPAGLTVAVVGQVTISSVASGDTLLVAGGPGDDLIQLSNSTVTSSTVGLSATITGGPGNDTITAGLGADAIFGDRAAAVLPGDGDDTINSVDGAGNDVIHGGGGSNTITSDSGDQVFNP